MANGFGSLYVGASGLQNAQNAINTTANNLANVDTKGYVRQQVRYADKNYTILKDSRANVNMQQSGLGVSIGDVVHARDIFLDKTYRQETGRMSFYSARYETATYVEDLMQELNGQQFKQSVSDLWQAFQEVSTKPADSTNQNLVLQKADLLVSRTQKLYSDLQNYQSNINDQIKDDVDRVNTIGNRIYELNLQIQKVEAGGTETAMTLRDERDSLLDELGNYGRIEVTEDATGFAYVDMEGVRFVDENRCYNMGLKAADGTSFYTPYWPQQSDVEKGQYVPVFRLSGEISSEMNTDIGSIKSKLLVRGDTYGRREDMASEESYGNIEGCTLMEVEAELDVLFSRIVKSMNDIYCPNTETTSAFTSIDGRTYPAGTKILDEENCARGVDGELPPRELFTRIGIDRYTKVTGKDGKTYYVYKEEDPDDSSTRYAIGTITVNSDLKRQITLMPAYKKDGSVDYEMGAKLAAAWEVKDMKLNPYDQKPCTFEEYYDKMVDQLGIEGNTYKSVTETLSGAVSSVDSKRQQVSGVSSDEELSNMIKFQSAYNAASRFMNVISEMTETIVTGLK
ncbi:MAG: flagellar hook-associated protein FlgK [Agathobacter sp.]|nr:flagellar hook-associated protein FlgK [Lachnospiraceae bacterium]MDY2619845.1 flagellar hook-associated protein FlgK [Agathobacter sp.]